MNVPIAERDFWLLRPTWFGLVVGGIPLAAILLPLQGAIVSPEFLRRLLELTPLAVVVATTAAVFGTGRGALIQLNRALIASLAECVPLPLVVSLYLEQRWGYQAFSPENTPVAFVALLVWAICVGITGWLIGIGWTYLRRSSQ